MLINPTPYSHIQLIVPESYLWGGIYNDTAGSTMAALFDGDVDTWKIMSSASQWLYDSANALSYFALLYQHYGDDDLIYYKIMNNVGDDELAVTDGAEELIGQTENMWDYTGSPAKTYLTAYGKSAYSNVLLEYSAAALSQYHKINPSDTNDHTLRQVMFSRNYRVPMFNTPRDCEYTFSPQIGKNKIGLESPRFTLAQSYSMVGRHTFVWSALTAAEKLTFEFFLRAFGGNMARPFAMCIIHGESPSGVTNKVMTTHMLIIDEQTVKWKVDAETNRHGIEFSATELIRV